MIHTRNFIQEGNFESRNFTTEKSSNEIEIATSKMFSQSKNKGISWLGTLNGTLLQSNGNSKGKVWEDVPGFRQRAPS